MKIEISGIFLAFSSFLSFLCGFIKTKTFNPIVFISRELKRSHSLSTKIKSPPSNKCWHIFRRWMRLKRPRRFSHRTSRKICCCWRSKRVRLISNLALFTWKLAKNVTMRCWVTVGFPANFNSIRALGDFKTLLFIMSLTTPKIDWTNKVRVCYFGFCRWKREEKKWWRLIGARFVLLRWFSRLLRKKPSSHRAIFIRIN